MANPLDDYFITSHSGRAYPAVSVVGIDSAVQQDVYSCRACFALTMEPEAHAEWHEKEKEKKDDD